MFEIFSVAMPDPYIFIQVAASVADTAVDYPNSTKALLDNGLSTCFINGKATSINATRNLSNPPSLLIIFSVAHFNIFTLFLKELITFIISFISSSVSVIPEPDNNESRLLFFLPRQLNCAFK